MCEGPSALLATICKLDSLLFYSRPIVTKFYFIFILHAKTLGLKAKKEAALMVVQNNPKINDKIPKHDENMNQIN